MHSSCIMFAETVTQAHWEKKWGLPNRSRTYDILVTSIVALSLSHRILVEF